MDDDGPDDGDESRDEKKKPASRGNLIVLPGGKTVDPVSDLGVSYKIGRAHV